MNSGLFGSGILDVAIGLALVYLVLSIMASALSEVVSSIFNLRAQALEQFVRSLFMNPEIAQQQTKGMFRTIAGWMGMWKAQTQPTEPFVTHFYEKTLIAPSLYGKKRPAYIHAREFSLAVFDTIFCVKKSSDNTTYESTPGADWSETRMQDWRELIAKLPDDAPLKPVLLSILNKSENDAQKLRTLLENWFDRSMDRVSGWYKQRTQIFLLCTGLAISILLNVDTIAIANRLLQNPVLRATVADAAQKYLNNAQPPTTTPNAPATPDPSAASQTLQNSLKQTQEMTQLLVSLNIPLGWTEDSLADFRSDPGNTGRLLGLIFQKLIGLLITGFAISQGAPFWFDLLNRLTNIRGAGTPPKDVADEPSEPSDPTPVLASVSATPEVVAPKDGDSPAVVPGDG
jgi:hypothetical protein